MFPSSSTYKPPLSPPLSRTLVPCLPRDSQPLGTLTPPPWGCVFRLVPLAVNEVGVTDSDFFTRSDPYQKQGDERQPRYLMGSRPAGKYEGKAPTATPN